MINTKFILTNTNDDIYPGYLDKEKRAQLKNMFKGKKEYLKCACRPNAGLYYKISEDLKIYPEHNGYQHDTFCCRYKDPKGDGTERKTAYCIDENGDVIVFTSFDPKRFSRNADKTEKESNYTIAPDEEEQEQDNILIDNDTEEITEETKKEPQLGLEGLCRSINVDCFTEKVLNNKMIDNRKSFSTFVYYRMKKVKLSRNKKALGELSLEKDGARFIYSPFLGFDQNKSNNYSRCYLQTQGNDGKIFNNFTFPEIAEKALKQFRKQYGMEPDKNTMLAGFQYIKKNKSNDSIYRVLGRVHLFQISDIGLYCRNMTEYSTFNTLHKITRNNNQIRFWVPPEDESVGGIIEVAGKEKKILLLFKSKKSEEISFNPDMYVPLIVDANNPITEQKIYSMLS